MRGSSGSRFSWSRSVWVLGLPARSLVAPGQSQRSTPRSDARSFTDRPPSTPASASTARIERAACSEIPRGWPISREGRELHAECLREPPVAFERVAELLVARRVMRAREQ